MRKKDRTMTHILVAMGAILAVMISMVANAGEIRSFEVGITVPIRAMVDVNAIMDGTIHVNYGLTIDQRDTIINNISNTYITNNEIDKSRTNVRVNNTEINKTNIRVSNTEIHRTNVRVTNIEHTHNNIHHNTLSAIRVD